MNKKSNAFASSLMVDILHTGLVRLGLENIFLNASHSHAHIPIESKKAFVLEVVSRHGYAVLLQASVGIIQFQNSPTVKALLYKSKPESFIFRWQRFESYIHSQHFIKCDFLNFDSEYTGIKVSHCSKTDTRPSLAEDMAVLGVLCALIHLVVGKEVHLNHHFEPNQPVFSFPSLSTEQAPKQSTSWFIFWRKEAPPASSKTFKTRKDAFYPKETDHESKSTDLIEKTKMAVVELGLLDTSIHSVAKHLALSTRSLQRHLKAQNAKFASLLQIFRVERASYLLLSSDIGTAEIGFICGFSDQSHFHRVFKKLTGLSPKQFQQLNTLNLASPNLAYHSGEFQIGSTRR